MATELSRLDEVRAFADEVAAQRLEQIERDMAAHPEAYPGCAAAAHKLDKFESGIEPEQDTILAQQSAAWLQYAGALAHESYLQGVRDGGRIYHALITGELPRKENDNDEQKPKSVDEYITRQDESKRADLCLMRNALRNALPDAEERISWSMPTYWKGHNIVHFAASKNHIGFYPGAEAVEFFQEDLKQYKTAKGTIQIPYGELDTALIEKIARWCWETGHHA